MGGHRPSSLNAPAAALGTIAWAGGSSVATGAGRGFLAAAVITVVALALTATTLRPAPEKAPA